MLTLEDFNEPYSEMQIFQTRPRALGPCPLHTCPGQQILIEQLCLRTQEQAAALKAEVRAVLAEHGIDKFVIKPVRRNYAFELDSVPHGEQWVLKVRYSAAKPSLPNGLEGTRPMHPVLLPCQKAHLLAWIW